MGGKTKTQNKMVVYSTRDSDNINDQRHYPKVRFEVLHVKRTMIDYRASLQDRCKITLSRGGVEPPIPSSGDNAYELVSLGS